MNEIVPFLWFDGDAEEAVNLYVSLFPDSRIVDERRAEGGPEGPVFSMRFELMGRPYVAFNGGPTFRFNEAISLFADCQDQEEVDRLWEALSQGGEKSQCGWLKDRFGLSWQIIPQALGEMLYDPDPVKAGRVMEAMLKMGKIEIKELQRAYDGQ